MKKVPIRKTDIEAKQVGDVYDSAKRYYDQNLELTVVKLHTGDCYVTDEPREMLVTILGSCISVCARDPIAGCGGMNHILLPGKKQPRAGESDMCTRYGAYAMEELMNGLFKLGAHKDRIEVKMFGGANVMKNSTLIGLKNIGFVKQYLKDEGYNIISQNVGGYDPRRIHYYPDTGKVMMRQLKRKDDLRIVDVEQSYQEKMSTESKKTDVDLF